MFTLVLLLEYSHCPVEIRIESAISQLLHLHPLNLPPKRTSFEISVVSHNSAVLTALAAKNNEKTIMRKRGWCDPSLMSGVVE